jgi:hypothetical protein
MRVLLRLVVVSALLGGTAAMAGCNVAWNYLEDGLIRDDRVTEVRITGGSGDLTVVRDDAVKGVDIRRKARYRGAEPHDTMRVEGGVAQLASDCGPTCSASYEVHVPYGERGVKVTGDVGSGDVTLTSVSDVDIQLGSGDVEINGASGAVSVETSSGNVKLSDVAGDVRAVVNSGDIEGRGLRGAKVSTQSDSGNVTLTVSGTGDVTVKASSGDITVNVPDRTVVITADTDSGDRTINVAESTAAGAKRLDLHTNSGDITVKSTI